MTDTTHYDLVQAAVAAALVRVVDIAMRYHADALEWAKKVRGLEDHIGETDTFKVAQDILALITPDAQAALDRVVAAERERGFWLGRSCGGSKAEIDAALAAIREGGE